MKNTETTTLRNIEMLLKKARYSKRYVGYKELVYCVKLVLEDENRLCALLKVYKEIGERYQVNWNCVEKNIRKVNESAWKRGGKEFINDISGQNYPVVPQTGELLEIFLDYLKDDLVF